MEAKITLSYRTAREARAVAEAISPDNVETPPGLVVQTTRRGSKVSTSIECERGLPTFIATIDDLLSCVSIAQRAFTVAKER